MEKLIEGLLSLIEVILITGMIGFGSTKAIQYAHDEMKKQTIQALKHPTPSLSKFTRELLNGK